jgi:predicted kinase
MKLLDKLIKNNFDYSVDWKEVEKIPHFLKLKDGGFHIDWHTEGDSLTHTKLTVDEVYKLPEWNDLNSFEKLCLVGAALFHDIGKGISHKLDENGNWTAPKHSIHGEKLTRYLLWDEQFEVREMICSLIRYHMKPKYFEEKDESVITKTVIEISHNSNCKLLYLLDLCDRAGALGPHREEEIKKCEELKWTATFLGCFDNPYYFFSKHVKFDYFFDKSYTFSRLNEYSKKFDFTVYIMCGVAGSGKSTYVKEYLNELPVISRDKVRVELGYINDDGKFKGDKKQESTVSQIIDEKIKNMCQNSQSFIYDNLNIRKKYRDEFIESIKSFRKYNAEIVIIYVETSRCNNISRRKNQIASSQIEKMQNTMDMVYPSEAHKLIVYRN